MKQTARLSDIIEDPEAFAYARENLSHLDPLWDRETVDVKWIGRGYYGFMDLWALSNSGGAYLMSPSRCKGEYRRGSN